MRETVWASLLNAVKTETVNHAYIFCGQTSLGRKAFAEGFAKALNCESPAAAGACGLCLSCRVFISGNHPDVIYVKGSGLRSIVADDVREQVVRPMSLKPFRYTYKVFILDQAETLTTAAQNVLLKTLEEPAPYGVFLLLARHSDDLLPTVLSRCALIKLRDSPDIHENVIASEEKKAMGELAGEAASVRGLDILETMALYKKFAPYKESIQILLDMLYMEYGKKIKNGENLFDSANSILHTKDVLRQNGNFQLAIELMLLQLNENKNRGKVHGYSRRKV